MSVAMPAQGTGRGGQVSVLAGVLALVVAVSTLLGTALAVQLVTDRPTPRAADPALVLPLGMTARTAGLDVTVGHVRDLVGLSHGDLAGNTHGVSGLVSDESRLVQATVHLRNDTHDDLPFDPGHFRLRAGNTYIRASSGTLGSGTLLAGTSVDGTVQFLLPRDQSRLVLEIYDDRGLLAQFDATPDARPPSAAHDAAGH